MKQTLAHSFICIPLSAQVNSSLNWELAKQKAKELASQGLSIMWDLKLGIEQKDLIDEGEFKALEFSLLHFLETIYEPFAQYSKGVILYRGGFDFPADLVITFAALLPDSLTPFVFLEEEETHSSYSIFKTLCQEGLEHFHFIGKHALFIKFPYALPFYQCENERIFASAESGTPITKALLLPEAQDPLFEKTLNYLEKEAIPFRMVSESRITTSWEGIDDFIIFPHALTKQGQRKLLGFQAAGGNVVSAESLFCNGC